MHGAIVSDCFGVPWIGYGAYTYINSVKWNDWLSVVEHKTTLCQVDSLYKGYVGLNINSKVKQEAKHFLKFLGLWNNGWYKAIPRKSTTEEQQRICDQFKDIIEQDDFYCTSSNLIEQQLVKLRAKIEELKNGKY